MVSLQRLGRIGSTYFGVLFFAARLPFVHAAEFSGDATNDLFSDLGPLLALFGEQVAKQFMASSTTWEDNVLFAMGPLGIVTAVVSAIRIGGPLWLRALVGRARESRAAAEEELTTSTSHDVCEIWNGQSVVRLVGSPRILQLVYLADMDGTEPEDRILTLETKTKTRCRFTKAWKPKKQKRLPLSTEIIPPNLFLNLRPSITLSQRWEIRTFTFISVVLQAFAVAFSGLITYHPTIRDGYKKDGEDMEPHAFPLTAIGTAILVLGMWVCSFVIESSTTEHNWQVQQASIPAPFMDEELSPPKSFHVLWLQQGGAVTDQQFDSFTIIAKGIRAGISTSRLTSSLIDPSGSFQAITTFGAITSIGGFVIQFTGLRSMHYAATLSQLIVTVIMVVIRAWLRRGLSARPLAYKIPQGYEMDWLATRLAFEPAKLW
ncbi:hypothetical protein BJ508DRAFT_209014, partial [Ascobolus immersus RN42]